MTHPLAGNQLRIRIRADAERIVAARLERRTVSVARLMVGRPVGEIPGLVASLLPICAASHRAAAMGAIETAAACPPQAIEARAVAVLGERVANGVWRLGLDLPSSLGLPRLPAPVLAARDAARTLTGDRITAGNALAALAGALADVAAIVDDAYDAAARFPSASGLEELARRAADDPRHALDSLRSVLAGTADPAPHAGLDGMVTTSRGALDHRCMIADGIATDWSIHTPTDRIAAPDGPIAGALVGLPHGGRPFEAARIVTALHDPCEDVAILLEDDAHA
ncbi:MAG: hypothetical protein ACK50Q_18370 [Labrys sp. (in: a-proteobacteria)]